MYYRQVHLDFHTSEHIANIGSEFDKKQFQEAVRTMNADSLTLFAKCHHGWMYYNSEKFERHPELRFDLLKSQIEACEEIGVDTVVYLSAGFDEKTVRQHPEWAVCDKSGAGANFAEASFHWLCFNTDYLDLLLAQVEEVLTVFPGKSIFMDIADVTPCRCPKCTADMKAAGIDVTDDAQVELFAEKVYYNYTSKVRELIERLSPKSTVFHNAGHIMRGNRKMFEQNTRIEVESLPTAPIWGYDHFPITAAYMRAMRKEYTGMTGKFHSQWGDFGGYKTANALKYETSLILANGGHCSIGDQLHPFGKYDTYTAELIGSAYSEVKKKEAWCRDAEYIADVAVLSCEALSCGVDIGRASAAQTVDSGAVRMLNEANFLYEVIDFESDFSRYKVIILPDIERIKEKLSEKLHSFVADGGKLLASGCSGLAFKSDEFIFDFGAEYIGRADYDTVYAAPYLENIPKAKYAVFSPAFHVEGEEKAGEIYAPFFNRTPEHFSSHMQTPPSEEVIGPLVTFGKDGAYISYEIFSEYASEGRHINRQIFTEVCNRLLGDRKTLETDLLSQGTVTLSYQPTEHRYVVHLVYGSPIKRGSIQVIEDLPPLYNVALTLRIQNEIERAYLAPSGEQLQCLREGDAVRIAVPEVSCHQMVVLDVKI